MFFGLQINGSMRQNSRKLAWVVICHLNYVLVKEKKDKGMEKIEFT